MKIITATTRAAQGHRRSNRMMTTRATPSTIDEMLAAGLVAEHARTAGSDGTRCGVCRWPILPGHRIADLADGSGPVHIVRCAAKASRTPPRPAPAPSPRTGIVAPATGKGAPPGHRSAAQSRPAARGSRERHAAAQTGSADQSAPRPRP